jgi:Flp pilus assembly protein TadG
MAMVVILGLLIGLVVDVGSAMAAKTSAMDIAQQAARAGANQLDLQALRTDGTVRLDPAAAQVAAETFLAAADATRGTQRGTQTSDVTATPALVTVTIVRAQPTSILSAIGFGSLAVRATAYAAPATGPENP